MVGKRVAAMQANLVARVAKGKDFVGRCPCLTGISEAAVKRGWSAHAFIHYLSCMCVTRALLELFEHVGEDHLRAIRGAYRRATRRTIHRVAADNGRTGQRAHAIRACNAAYP
jgi:hypothetical protein